MPYEHTFTVPQEAIDRNGHVNNVVYVQWMQDVAIMHSDATGGTKAAEDSGGAWVARAHHIEYLRPAYEGDEIIARTWISDAQRATSQRRYQFLRKGDETVIAHGSTDWVFVDAGSGRPRRIPQEVNACYVVEGDAV